MTSTNSGPMDAVELRTAAEKKAREEAIQSPENIAALSPAEIGQLLHELRVHQIELEMQNEELRRAQVELDTVRARYFDLYDLAPVGYCTLAETGLILEANLTVATLLGVARGALVRQPLSRFILNQDEDLYYRYRKQLFETGQPQVCELRMVNKDGAAIWIQLDATVTQDPAGARVCRTVLSDISEGKQTEAQLREQLDELRRWHNITLGREGRIMELKKEVNQLLAGADQPPRYASVT